MRYLPLLAILLPLAASLNCPNPSDIPVMDERTQKYTTALLFQVLITSIPFHTTK